MDLCSLPNFWPFTRSLLALLFMLIGAGLLIVWILFIIQYTSKQKIMLRQNSLLRYFIKINRQRWAMALIFCLILVGADFFKTQLTTGNPCFVFPSTFDPSTFLPWFVALYLLVGVMHSQGLGCHVAENIKVSWDRGNILSLHLSGRPNEVLEVLKGDIIEKVDTFAKQFEAACLPSTVRVESWLFLRHAGKHLKKDLHTLHELTNFPALTDRIAALKAQPKRFWRVLAVLIFRIALLMSLVARFGRINNILLIMTMPEFAKVTCTACGAPTTPDIAKAIESLQLLDSSRRFGVLPIRKFTTWEVIHLIANYPTLGNHFVPWTTGFQFTK